MPYIATPQLTANMTIETLTQKYVTLILLSPRLSIFLLLRTASLQRKANIVTPMIDHFNKECSVPHNRYTAIIDKDNGIKVITLLFDTLDTILKSYSPEIHNPSIITNTRTHVKKIQLSLLTKVLFSGYPGVTVNP